MSVWCLLTVFVFLLVFTVNFDHFQILRAIGKGSFGKVTFHFHAIDVCAYACIMCFQCPYLTSVPLVSPEAYLLQLVYKFASDVLCMEMHFTWTRNSSSTLFKSQGFTAEVHKTVLRPYWGRTLCHVRINHDYGSLFSYFNQWWAIRTCKAFSAGHTQNIFFPLKSSLFM